MCWHVRKIWECVRGERGEVCWGVGGGERRGMGVWGKARGDMWGCEEMWESVGKGMEGVVKRVGCGRDEKVQKSWAFGPRALLESVRVRLYVG